MILDESLRKKRNEILQIAKRHGITGIKVFGSAVRGELTPDSDIDFLIEVGGPTPPWFPGGLVAELSELLERKIDVVELEAVESDLKSRILSEATPL